MADIPERVCVPLRRPFSLNAAAWVIVNPARGGQTLSAKNMWGKKGQRNAWMGGWTGESPSPLWRGSHIFRRIAFGMAKRGRPLTYTREISDRLLELVASGRSVRSASEEVGIRNPTVFEWVNKDVDGFSERYACAREAQAEVHAGEILEILDTKPTQVVTTKADGTVETKDDPAHVAWLKNRADGRKWIAAKLKPKTFGDKLDVEHSGAIDIGAHLDAAKKRAVDGEAS